MDERDLRLDGNAVAGLLTEALAAEPTASMASCAGCGASNQLGALLAYVHGMGAIQVASYGSGFHIRNAFPGFGTLGEIALIGGFGLHQIALPAVGPQASIDDEHDTLAGV